MRKIHVWSSTAILPIFFDICKKPYLASELSKKHNLTKNALIQYLYVLKEKNLIFISRLPKPKRRTKIYSVNPNWWKIVKAVGKQEGWKPTNLIEYFLVESDKNV